MARIFISYSRTDEAFARRLATSLSQMGADIWMDIEDIPAGMKWSSAIQQGLDGAEVLIVAITPESMASRNVEDEWQYSLDNRKPVIPILLRPAKIHFQLSRIQYIDFHTQPYEVALQRLQYELARQGYPVGTAIPPSHLPPPPQTYAHPTGQVSTVKPPVQSSRSLRPLLIGLAGLGLIAVLAGVLFATYQTQQALSIQQTEAAVARTELALLAAATQQLFGTATAQNLQTTPTFTLTPEVTETAETTSTPTTPAVFTGPVSRNRDWTPLERTINGVPMVLVPSGRFTMGATKEQIEYGYQICTTVLGQANCPDMNDESALWAVEIGQPFWIDQYEYTHTPGSGTPVNNIRWDEAQALCGQRGGRLPRESEWEYAARGADNLLFPWGDEVSPALMNVCDQNCEFGWADRNNDGYAERAPVGSFAAGASWVGAQDMAGNLWEWTSTVYAYNSNEGYQASDDLNAQRVLKGSSWNWIAAEGRATSRATHARNYPSSDWYGFRCVRDFNAADLR